jgi:hypothetical protein
MLKVNTMNLKHSKSVLLGTSALVCFALAAPVMADDFVITSSDGSTNGVGTTNGGTAAAIAATAINGSDTVSLGIALITTGAGTDAIFTKLGGNQVHLVRNSSILFLYTFIKSYSSQSQLDVMNVSFYSNILSY